MVWLFVILNITPRERSWDKLHYGMHENELHVHCSVRPL